MGFIKLKKLKKIKGVFIMYMYKNELQKLKHRIAIQKLMASSPIGSIIKITDKRDYEEGKSNNGGCYIFIDKYIKVGGNQWEAHYYTSADFPYSEKSGCFISNWQEEEDEEYGVYKDIDLIPLIQEQWFTENIFISICEYAI